MRNRKRKAGAIHPAAKGTVLPAAIRATVPPVLRAAEAQVRPAVAAARLIRLTRGL